MELLSNNHNNIYIYIMSLLNNTLFHYVIMIVKLFMGLRKIIILERLYFIILFLVENQFQLLSIVVLNVVRKLL